MISAGSRITWLSLRGAKSGRVLRVDENAGVYHAMTWSGVLAVVNPRDIIRHY